jgi:hypothetical protein
MQQASDQAMHVHALTDKRDDILISALLMRSPMF